MKGLTMKYFTMSIEQLTELANDLDHPDRDAINEALDAAIQDDASRRSQLGEIL